MRIMAAHAIHDGRIDVDMGFFERISLHVVALSAEGLDSLHKQPRLRRIVRLVTGQAITRRGRVIGFLVHAVLQALVARQTHFRGLRQQ